MNSVQCAAAWSVLFAEY